MKKLLAQSMLVMLFISRIETSRATEFEPLGKAAAAALGTTKAFRKTVNLDNRDVMVFYSKDAAGKPAKYAFVEKGVYEPNCSHTWVVGVDARTRKVSEVRVVEMSCPHAFPTRAASFLGQFKGKGPADVARLSSQISTIAKATGSADLTTAAVKRSITAATKLQGKL